MQSYSLVLVKGHLSLPRSNLKSCSKSISQELIITLIVVFHPAYAQHQPSLRRLKELNMYYFFHSESGFFHCLQGRKLNVTLHL